MQKSYFKSLAWLQGLNILIKPIWIFGMDRLAQVQMGDAVYGKYIVVFNFCLLFNILLDLGLNNFVAAKIASNQSLNLNQILRWRLLLALVYTGLVLSISNWHQWGISLILIAIFNQIIASLVLYFRSILQGLHLFKQDAIVSVTDRSLSLIAGFVYLSFFNFTHPQAILAFFGIQTVGYIGALILAVLWTRSTPKQSQSQSFLTIWKQVQWFAILALVMSIFTRVDSYMLSLLSTGKYSDAGIYAKGFRLLDAALIFSGLLSTLLLPMYSKLKAENGDTAPIISLSNRIIFTAAIPFVLLGIYYAPALMSLLYPGHSSSSISTFSLIISAFLPMAMVHVFGTYLSATNRNKWVSLFALASMVINIVLNLWLIPKHGHYGAALACIITQSTFALLCFGTCRWVNAYAWQSLKLYKLVLFVFISFLLFNLFAPMHPSLIWGIGLSIFTALLGIAMLFPSIKQLKTIISKNN